MDLSVEELQAKEDYLRCSKTLHELAKKYPWLSRWGYLKASCEDSSCSGYKLFGAKGVRFFLSAEEAKEIWVRDCGGFLQKPTMRRVDDSRPFTFDNCEIAERIPGKPGRPRKTA